MLYSLRSIILFAKVDVSRHILVIDTSIFAKSNMGRREYMISEESQEKCSACKTNMILILARKAARSSTITRGFHAEPVVCLQNLVGPSKQLGIIDGRLHATNPFPMNGEPNGAIRPRGCIILIWRVLYVAPTPPWLHPRSGEVGHVRLGL
jgi:hypothetical protein